MDEDRLEALPDEERELRVYPKKSRAAAADGTSWRFLVSAWHLQDFGLEGKVHHLSLPGRR